MLPETGARIKAAGVDCNLRRPLRRLLHDLDELAQGGRQVVVLGAVDVGDAGLLEGPDSLRRRQLRRRLR